MGGKAVGSTEAVTANGDCGRMLVDTASDVSESTGPAKGVPVREYDPVDRCLERVLAFIENNPPTTESDEELAVTERTIVDDGQIGMPCTVKVGNELGRVEFWLESTGMESESGGQAPVISCDSNPWPDTDSSTQKRTQ